jgi:hypothetical protein
MDVCSEADNGGVSWGSCTFEGLRNLEVQLMQPQRARRTPHRQILEHGMNTRMTRKAFEMRSKKPKVLTVVNCKLMDFSCCNSVVKPDKVFRPHDRLGRNPSTGYPPTSLKHS